MKRFMDANRNIFEADGDAFHDRVQDYFLSPVQLEYDRVRVASLASLVGAGAAAGTPAGSAGFSSSVAPRTPASVSGATQAGVADRSGPRRGRGT